MASNATQTFRYLVRVPGARKIRIRQQKTGIIGGSFQRRYETLTSKDVSPTADPAKYVETLTKKGLSWGWRWKNQFKVVATFGTGTRQNTKTWRFSLNESKSMTLRCPSCVATAAFTVGQARVLKANGKPALSSDKSNGAFDSNNVIGGLATVGMSMVPGAGVPSDVEDTGVSASDSSVTDEAGEGDVDVFNVDANGTGTPEQVSEEIDALVDEGAVVVVDEGTEEVLAPIEEGSALVDALPFTVPAAVEPYVIPAAGAVVGGIAGRLFLDRGALGAIAGGVAGFFLGDRR